MKKLVLAGCATLFLTTGSSEYNNLTDDQLSDAGLDVRQ
jgi:hypothetical protein